MIDGGEEFRQYMKAIDTEPEGKVERHPGEGELVAYGKNSLGEADKAQVQRHVADCARCREVLEDMSDFFEPAREGEETVSEIEIARAWRSIERRLDAELKDGRGDRRPSSWLLSSSVLALAASLVLALGLGTWTYVVLIPSRARSIESQTSTSVVLSENLRRALEARLAELETENRELQARSARLESQNSALKQPQANAPIFDVFSAEWVQRSGGEAQVLEVRVRPEARSYVLVLTGEGQPGTGEHVLDILDQKGARVWRGEGLKRDEHGSFVLTLDRSFLKDGEYRLVLYSKRADELVRVTDYRVRVKNR